jgi:aldehyde:ferredoxin oxidoreductase
MEQPIRSGEMQGELLDREGWEGMLDEYYAVHGWDRETGWQTKDTLKALDLDEVAWRLDEVGRLK